jgi:hypothetical protein
MDVTITNISAAPVAIGDLYTTIPVGGSVSTKRSASQLSAMVGLQKAVEAGSVTVAATLEAHETASGLAIPSGTVEAGDMAAVAAGAVAAAEVTFRKAFTTVASTDVAVFAANTLPYKMRILDAYMLISTVQAGSSAQLWPQAAGAGTAITDVGLTSAPGKIPLPLLGGASVVLTPGALIGLFLLPSAHSGVVGELVVTARREV